MWKIWIWFYGYSSCNYHPWYCWWVFVINTQFILVSIHNFTKQKRRKIEYIYYYNSRCVTLPEPLRGPNVNPAFLNCPGSYGAYCPSMIDTDLIRVHNFRPCQKGYVRSVLHCSVQYILLAGFFYHSQPNATLTNVYNHVRKLILEEKS